MTCDSFDDDEYIQAEVINWGSDDNTSYVPGTIVKVSCVKGFGVNLPNETTECKNGKWKPKVPSCSARMLSFTLFQMCMLSYHNIWGFERMYVLTVPCKTPYIPHGTFYEMNKPLFFQELVKHMKKVEFHCSKGYVLKGPSTLGCWFGEWDVIEAPKCLPSTNSIKLMEENCPCNNIQYMKTTYCYLMFHSSLYTTAD